MDTSHEAAGMHIANAHKFRESLSLLINYVLTCVQRSMKTSCEATGMHIANAQNIWNNANLLINYVL